MKKTLLALFGAAMLLAPCAGVSQPSDHGDTKTLGTVSVAGHSLQVILLGKIEASKEGAFQVSSADASAKKISGLNAYLWLEDDGGAQVSAPAKGIVEGDSLHFHVTPKAGSAPKRLVVRVRADGKDEKAALPLDGHGHEHASAPNDGVVAVLRDETSAQHGHIELKLHDDKGDLELWLAKDKNFTQPIDLPLSSSIRVTFVDLNNRVVELRPRDTEKNVDENGKPNVRNGATNYFIFPGNPKDDSSWLKGAEFQSIVQVAFETGGRTFTSEEFMLVPHTHGAHGHKH